MPTRGIQLPKDQTRTHRAAPAPVQLFMDNRGNCRILGV
jgi:hypothetical protein